MHKTVISKITRDRSDDAFGKRTPLPLIPGKFAHIIVDLQVGFLEPEAATADSNVRMIVPNVNKISAAVRSAGGLNIFIRFTFDPNWTTRYKRLRPETEGKLRMAFVEGSEQHGLWSGVDVQSEDLILNKTRISAFTPGTCDLDAVLRNIGIDTIIVTGCFSNACCESTCRDAVQMNYNVVFIQDGNATSSDDEHNGAVADLYSIFGCDICETEEVVKRLMAQSRT